MKLPAALRLLLVPIGVAIATKGLQHLADEAERLGAEIDARRAELVDTYTARGWVFPACEHRPNTKHENVTPCEKCPPPEDLPSTPASSSPPAGDSPVEHPTRPRIRVGAVVATTAAFGIGAYLSLRANRWLQDRAAAELVRVAGAPVAGDLPEPAPGTCGVFPAFGEPPTPCTLRTHESFRHSWEGGRGDLVDLDALRKLAEPAPTAEQVWDTYAEPAASQTRHDYGKPSATLACEDDCPCHLENPNS